MEIKHLVCLVALFLVLHLTTNAQSPAFNGWFFSSHEQKLSKKWSVLTDVQFRSAAKFSYMKAILLRPAVQYRLTDESSVAAGYVLFLSYEKDKGEREETREHRIWQQYVLQSKLGKSELTNRVRLEQRFLESATGGYDFAQRIRYYIRFQQPLIKAGEFKKGVYLAGQNELFLNIDNRQIINNRLFDQNRGYVGGGYRFSEALELEAGYMFRYQLQGEGRIRDHILQLTVNTKL